MSLSEKSNFSFFFSSTKSRKNIKRNESFKRNMEDAIRFKRNNLNSNLKKCTNVKNEHARTKIPFSSFIWK